MSRERPELYDELTRRFCEDPTVEVIVDRRVAERRQSDVVRREERRTADRREGTMQVTASLWLAGYVIVRVK